MNPMPARAGRARPSSAFVYNGRLTEHRCSCAAVAELVDAPGLGPGAARCEGSSPFGRTIRQAAVSDQMASLQAPDARSHFNLPNTIG
jgi:hypothetical protein